MMPALVGPRGEWREPLTHRLSSEFHLLSSDKVERCIADVQACMTHLGVDPTPSLVERMAREHLLGMIKSQPPSERGSGLWRVPCDDSTR